MAFFSTEVVFLFFILLSLTLNDDCHRGCLALCARDGSIYNIHQKFQRLNETILPDDWVHTYVLHEEILSKNVIQQNKNNIKYLSYLCRTQPSAFFL